MIDTDPAPAADRLALIRWTARMGAVTPEARAIAQNTTPASARARLREAMRAGLLECHRPLAQRPVLYVLSRTGMRECGLRGLDPCRVSATNAGHLIACAAIAGALEGRYPDHRVLGERELRRDERELGAPVASAQMGVGSHGEPLLHRPDLVLWPGQPAAGLPVAVEVELTIKAPRRLTDICRAWARCRTVAGVLYIAPAEVARALERAIARAHAQERFVVVGPEALSDCLPGTLGQGHGRPPENTVPSDA